MTTRMHTMTTTIKMMASMPSKAVEAVEAVEADEADEEGEVKERQPAVGRVVAPSLLNNSNGSAITNVSCVARKATSSGISPPRQHLPWGGKVATFYSLGS
jgi:hypothetical protein